MDKQPKQPAWIRFYAVYQTYQRQILIVLLTVGLGLLLSLLPQITFQSLVRGFLAQHALLNLLMLFSLLALSLLFSVGQAIDSWVFLLFNMRRARPLWLDRFMWAVTQIGNMILAEVFAVILYFVFRLHRLAIEILLGMFTLWIVVEAVKAITDRARPYLTLQNVRVIGWREPGQSFPSGHTAQTFFLVTLLIHHFQPLPWVTFILFGVAILVGFTRMYVGAHYPRDVLAGALLGIVWGISVTLLDGYLVGRPV